MKSAKRIWMPVLAAAGAYGVVLVGALSGSGAPGQSGVAITGLPVSVAHAETALPDPARGEKLFAKCKTCHTVEKGGKNKVGPALWSIFNRPIASVEGFKYSKPMVALSGEVWDAARLDRYLADPKRDVPGNKMAFLGLKKEDERHDMIAYLAHNGDTPVAPDALGFGGSAAATASGAETATAAAPQIPDEVPPAVDPTQPGAAELAEMAARAAAIEKALPGIDYERARYDPIHFSPAIEKASDQECLVCHREILDHKPREASPSGVKSTDTIAWYQTLDTYSGDQATFHWRHVESPFAKQVMNLSCNFCHKGNDPREESPAMEPDQPAFTRINAATAPFTARKMVNPSTTCLRCHGPMPDPVNIMGLGGAWPEVRADMETEDAPNGCLSCHADTFRTVRHRVTYLKGASIEEAAKAGSSDTCYGCHGGRAWYRISYPYPRHPWPGMDPETPDWAKDRPVESDPQYQLKPAAAK